jgi:hypothetical protein
MNKINTMNGNDNKTMKKLELAMRTETTGNCPALGERSALEPAMRDLDNKTRQKSR